MVETWKRGFKKLVVESEMGSKSGWIVFMIKIKITFLHQRQIRIIWNLFAFTLLYVAGEFLGN